MLVDGKQRGREIARDNRDVPFPGEGILQVPEDFYIGMHQQRSFLAKVFHRGSISRRLLTSRFNAGSRSFNSTGLWAMKSIPISRAWREFAMLAKPVRT